MTLLFAIAYWADRRARQGRSVVGSPWVYSLSMAVYCTAWTYFGSVGRAATAGVWFLPIYLGPMLAMTLAWVVIRKMVRISRAYRITSIADFISSRYGKSPVLAGTVTFITVVGIVPYIALQLKAISVSFAVMTASDHAAPLVQQIWWQDSTFYLALVLAGFTMAFGARQLDNSERHEGMVAAIAFESVVKLVAFLAVGVFVTYGLFDGIADIFTKAQEVPELAQLLTVGVAQGKPFAYAQWFGLLMLAMFSVILLPRQFQVMVVENVDEQHLRRAAWAFPLYLLLINLFVLPIALGGLLVFGVGLRNPETFVLTLPLSLDHPSLAFLAFLGGLSASTGMIVVEAIAVSTMVSNDLLMPLLLRARKWAFVEKLDLTRLLLHSRRAAILLVLMLGYVYDHLADDSYALVNIGLISFAAVAQFAPALFGGMYWRSGTRQGAMAGLLLGFAMWAYTLMLPSLARSGWMDTSFIDNGLLGSSWLKPEELLRLQGLDNLTHSLFWSLLLNMGAYVGVSLWRMPSAQETSQALLFVDVFERISTSRPVFWRGQASVSELFPLVARFLGLSRAEQLFDRYAQQLGLQGRHQLQADPRFVQYVETQLAGAIGSASARVMVASVVKEDSLDLDDVMRILDEATQLRLQSRELEQKSRSLELATAELRAANDQLKSLDRLKDDFMSSVTHELRTPLTSIRALSELMRDDAEMESGQRQQFLSIIVSEVERLTRLVNQVLDMAKIEAGHADWQPSDVDLVGLIKTSVQTTAELFRERAAQTKLSLPAGGVWVRADADRLTQVMLNLLSNAAKFVPAGRGEVHVILEQNNGRAVVRVRDNGPGVAPDQHGLVFEKFRQGGDSLNRPQGTGLGLPISRQIVEHFGGHMWLEPQPKQGACFAFDLPLLLPTQESNGGGAWAHTY